MLMFSRSIALWRNRRVRVPRGGSGHTPSKHLSHKVRDLPLAREASKSRNCSKSAATAPSVKWRKMSLRTSTSVVIPCMHMATENSWYVRYPSPLTSNAKNAASMLWNRCRSCCFRASPIAALWEKCGHLSRRTKRRSWGGLKACSGVLTASKYFFDRKGTSRVNTRSAWPAISRATVARARTSPAACTPCAMSTERTKLPCAAQVFSTCARSSSRRGSRQGSASCQSGARSSSTCLILLVSKVTGARSPLSSSN
mmetsp:Transcript_94295/g.215724  ORF Transcript_94295/g.215724 Transcript_94295/m.215724 type:complete len:255 (-) Transcript_94295:1113-1877(-)